MRVVIENYDWALASGLGLEPDTFVRFCDRGPHLVASTFVELRKVCEPGTAIPGLYGETPDGRWLAIDPPENCVAVQPAWQLWYLTAGRIPRVRHMVIFDERNRDRLQQAKRQCLGFPRTQLQYFSHGWTENVLQPLSPFRNAESEKQFPPQWVGEFVLDRLEEINLLKTRPLQRPLPDNF